MKKQIKSIAEYARENYKTKTSMQMLEELLKYGFEKKKIYDAFRKLRGRGLPLAQFPNNPMKENAVTPVKKKDKFIMPAPTITVEEFDKKNNPIVILRNFVSQIQKGSLYSERDVVTALLSGMPAYRQFVENPEFVDNRGRCNGTWYWGHKEDIIARKKNLTMK